MFQNKAFIVLGTNVGSWKNNFNEYLIKSKFACSGHNSPWTGADGEGTLPMDWVEGEGMLPTEEFRLLLGHSLISVCPPGKWTDYSWRHIESASSACSIISNKLDVLGPFDFLEKDKFLQLPIYWIDGTLESVGEAIQQNLDNPKDSLERGKANKEFYDNYCKLNNSGGYNDFQWNSIQEQFLNLNINF